MDAPPETHRHAVLVAEDDFDTRVAFVELARTCDVEATAAANGSEALVLLRAGLRPCLIVLDIAMPEMDGLAFRRAQLADPTLAGIPVAVMSGGGWVAESEARNLGITMFLRKPVEPDDLLRLFRDHCSKTR